MPLPKKYDIFTNRSVRLSEELAKTKAEGREIKRLMDEVPWAKPKKPKIGKCRKARR